MIDRACISLGELCNLKCAYCHFQNERNGKLSGLPQEFTSDEMIEIADNIHQYTIENNLPVFKIGIVGAGETLLQFEKIRTLIEYIKQKNYTHLQFYTITNGTVFKKDMLDFFFELGIAVIGIYLLFNFIPFVLILLGVIIEFIGKIISHIFGGK